MRFKQLWTTFPLPAKVKLFWERVTFSRITKLYFLFSVLHCLVQVIFQAQAFSTNAKAANFLWQLVMQAKATDPGFAVFSNDELRFCESVPDGFSASSCQQIWSNSSAVSSSVEESSTLTGTTSTVEAIANTVVATTSSLSVQPTESASSDGSTVDIDGTKEEEEEEEEIEEEEEDIFEEEADDEELEKRGSPKFEIAAVETNGTTEVIIDGFGYNNKTVTLTRQCLYTLNYPVERLDNTKREDITFIAFQFWVLGMSIVAILNESIPHIIASLLTHILATGWGGFQINHTARFRAEFSELTTNGACKGNQLLGSYWHNRMVAELTSLSLNAVALLLSGILSWRLFKAFGWQTFKRVGASRTINRIYKLVLTMSIAIQLSIFFIAVSIGLWLDALCNGKIGRLSKNPTLFKGLMATVIVLLVPWLTTGWIAVRRELRIPMLIFLVLSVGYLCGWAAMFVSPTFRWTFMLWRFFMLMTSASVLLTLLTLILGILCRINFGKGLPRYLNAEEPLPDDFVPVAPAVKTYDDEEKVEFPSGHGALPTYSAAFARDTPPSQMKFGPRLGPRFTNPSVEPFESSSEGRYSQRTAYSGYPHSQTATDSGYQTSLGDTYARQTVPGGPVQYGQGQHSRQASVGSQKSYMSYTSNSSAKTYGSGRGYRSNSSTSDSDQRNDPFSKRWMIE